MSCHLSPPISYCVHTATHITSSAIMRICVIGRSIKTSFLSSRSIAKIGNNKGADHQILGLASSPTTTQAINSHSYKVCVQMKREHVLYCLVNGIPIIIIIAWERALRWRALIVGVVVVGRPSFIISVTRSDLILGHAYTFPIVSILVSYPRPHLPVRVAVMTFLRSLSFWVGMCLIKSFLGVLWRLIPSLPREWSRFLWDDGWSDQREPPFWHSYKSGVTTYYAFSDCCSAAATLCIFAGCIDRQGYMQPRRHNV